MNKIHLKLFDEDKEIETVSIDKEHFLSGRHNNKEILTKMLERLENWLKENNED